MSIVKTLEAMCRDCYRCVRACPVKAIGIKNNQAFINQDRCINCGTCVKTCLQKAKVDISQLDDIKKIVKSGDVVACVAPSFAAEYPGYLRRRLVAGLRGLGFKRVEETSIGADAVASYTKKLVMATGRGGISTACPAVVDYVQTYMPEHIDLLLPIVSPMIAHAKITKALHPDMRAVFIGPCVAKKAEAQQEKYKGIVDGVLTFRELNGWFAEEGIVLDECCDSGFDQIGHLDTAKLFPLPGGMIKTAGLDGSIDSINIVHTSGPENTITLLKAAVDSNDLEVIEPLFCEGGCIGGAGNDNTNNIFEKRNDIIEYAHEKEPVFGVEEKMPTVDLSTSFVKKPFPTVKYTEQDILDVYEHTYKSAPENRLNCGACGYNSCEENAIAILNGMAEYSMCIPYMRRRAENRADTILEHAPEGVVILDEALTIQSLNPAFEKYFSCSSSIIGRKISYLLESTLYERVLAQPAKYLESIIEYMGKEFHQVVFYLPMEKHYVGIYMDLSNIKLNEAKIQSSRDKTIRRVEKLIAQNLEMAQKMADYLGESAARSETLLEELTQSDD
ncbi:MAG TPA: [Fe-Fe] hydrogenase large subunit C-terminal domain-containing protein [Candidatus Limiplasma sp.]|nr:[Fe-Fe] hydrogenase large subunit C-terminal domain-containing protein [Candidatus Limiplasma sp.]